MSLKAGEAETANIRMIEGSGNVFADLELPDPENALAKARLADTMGGILKEAGLTQSRASELLGPARTTASVPSALRPDSPRVLEGVVKLCVPQPRKASRHF